MSEREDLPGDEPSDPPGVPGALGAGDDATTGPEGTTGRAAGTRAPTAGGATDRTDLDYASGSELADPRQGGEGLNEGESHADEVRGGSAGDAATGMGGGAEGGPADPFTRDQQDPEDAPPGAPNAQP